MLGLGSLARKVFGTPNDRKVKSVRPVVAQINALEAEYQALSDEGIIGDGESGMAYGLGLTKVQDSIGHDGGITGFRSSMLAVPETGEVLITLANVIPTRDGGDPAAVLMNALLGE